MVSLIPVSGMIICGSPESSGRTSWRFSRFSSWNIGWSSYGTMKQLSVDTKQGAKEILKIQKLIKVK